MKQVIRKQSRDMALVVIGSLIFVVGISLFITPVHIFSGGVMGLSQIIRTLLQEVGIYFDFEISGIINFVLNVPLMVLAYHSISKRFFYFTLLSVFSQTVFFMIVPVLQEPILKDMLASCMVGGFIGGFGIGLVLRARGSGGGLDILGIFFSKKYNNFSVGKLSLLFNTALFTLSAILFSVEIAIYSMLFLVVFIFVVDKVHYQNINMTAMIFTRHPEVTEYITRSMHRGVTYWQGAGGYTHENTYILMTAISKYEITLLKNEVKAIDPHAFIIFSEGLSVSGNFEKRL